LILEENCVFFYDEVFKVSVLTLRFWRTLADSIMGDVILAPLSSLPFDFIVGTPQTLVLKDLRRTKKTQ
jgi:hypothetical protein